MNGSPTAQLETFRNFEGHVETRVEMFTRRYQIYNHSLQEELHSIALLMYCIGYRSYQQGGDVSFQDWVSKKIWNGMKNYLKNSIKPYRRFISEGQIGENGFDVAIDDHSQRLPDLIDTLSSDAKEVVRLVLDTPYGVRQAFLSDSAGPSGRSARGSIKNYLSGLNWSQNRIFRVFKEIKKSLS